MALIFRTDLECSRRDKQGVIFYHVRDPKSGANFDLYEIEYLMALKLDGVLEIVDVISQVEEDYDFPISREDFDSFMEQLSTLGFVRDLEVAGDDLDAAATQVFRTPIDDTATEQFKLVHTRALIEAGDTSHLAPKKQLSLRVLGLSIGTIVLAAALSSVGIYVVGGETLVRATAMTPSRVALYYKQPAQSVRAQRETWLSFAVSGRLAELTVKANQRVTAGEVLATLSLAAGTKKQLERAAELVERKQVIYDNLTAALDAIYADRSRIERDRDAADRALEKVESGRVGKGKNSRKDMRKWRNRRSTANKKLTQLVKRERKGLEKQTRAKLALDKARAQLETRELKVADKTLKAPFDGRVISLGDVHLGDRIEANHQLIHVLDPSHLEITFNLPKFKDSREGKAGHVVVEGQAAQLVTIAKVERDKDSKVVTVHLRDRSRELYIVKPKHFRLVREFRDPAFRVPARSIVKLDGKSQIAFMREGRVAWVPIKVLWKDRVLAAVEVLPGATVGSADMVLTDAGDEGTTLADLDNGDRVVMGD